MLLRTHVCCSFEIVALCWVGLGWIGLDWDVMSESSGPCLNVWCVVVRLLGLRVCEIVDNLPTVRDSIV